MILRVAAIALKEKNKFDNIQTPESKRLATEVENTFSIWNPKKIHSRQPNTIQKQNNWDLIQKLRMLP